jgi:hypothetical protein
LNGQFADKQGDRWSFVAVLPDTSFVHTIHHSKRTAEQAEVFLGKIKKKSDGLAPLFLSDAWFYEQALYKTYCRFEPRPYCGRGRPPHPLRIVDEKLKYAQVYKQRDSKGKLKSITTRIIKGTEAEILAIIRKGGRSKTINTSFVESRNGKYRKDDARLNRKTMCHSKKPKYHDAHADFLTAVFNYCRQNEALKELVNPDATLFEKKYLRKSPAMAEGLTDKILTVKELLFYRVPKDSIL